MQKYLRLAMVARNPHLAKLRSGYLFPEINKRKKALLERVPDARLISLGIGDTTEPIPPSITEALKKGAERLGTIEGYRGIDSISIRFGNADERVKNYNPDIADLQWKLFPDKLR